VSGKNLLF